MPQGNSKSLNQTMCQGAHTKTVPRNEHNSVRSMSGPIIAELLGVPSQVNKGSQRRSASCAHYICVYIYKYTHCMWVALWNSIFHLGNALKQGSHCRILHYKHSVAECALPRVVNVGTVSGLPPATVLPCSNES